jgi:hypothetical protein
VRTGAGRTPLIIAGVAALVTYAAVGEQTPFGFLHHFSRHHHALKIDVDTDDDVAANPTSETRSVAPFDSIQLEGATAADITIGDTQSLTVTSSGGVGTSVHDGKLVINGEGKAVHITVTVPHLRALQVDGAGQVTLAGLRDPIAIKANGPVHLSASGAVESAELTLNGPSKLSLTKLEAKNMIIKMNGVGDADVNATETLTAEVTGSGHVRYLGDAHTTAKIHGPGSVERISSSNAG